MIATRDAAIVDLPRLPLGRERMEDFDWRRGAGKAAFRRALVAEKRADWPATVTACRQALELDPGHLDASWLLAAALARQGRSDEVLRPLQIAAAGDWAKWGERSLELPLFAGFLATPTGAAWRRAAERYRSAYGEALARSVVLLGRSGTQSAPRGAELFAYDLGERRWLRLTRTGGAVAAVIDAVDSPLVAYVAVRSGGARSPARASMREIKIGVVDRSRGAGGYETRVKDAARVALSWRASSIGPRLEVEVVPRRGPPERSLIDWKNGSRQALPRPIRGDFLEVTPQGARRLRLPIARITADWDDGVASAFRIETSRTTVTPPALVDGHTLLWSPDGARLAFATAPDDPCGEGEARASRVLVADAATGRLHEVGRGDGPIQLRWISATRLAYVAGAAVRVIDAGGEEVAVVEGGAGLALDTVEPLRRCPTAAEGPFAAPPDDDEWSDDDTGNDIEHAGDVPQAPRGKKLGSDVGLSNQPDGGR